MNTDIRIHVNIFEHPKLKKLHRRMGADGVLEFLKLLCFAGRERPSGDITDLDYEDLALVLGSDEATTARLVETLIDLRLLDRGTDGTLKIHDWLMHNPWAAGAPQRTKASQRANHVRWHQRRGIADRTLDCPYCILEMDGDRKVDDDDDDDDDPELANVSVTSPTGFRLGSEADSPTPSTTAITSTSSFTFSPSLSPTQPAAVEQESIDYDEYRRLKPVVADWCDRNNVMDLEDAPPEIASAFEREFGILLRDWMIASWIWQDFEDME